jgi:hypothetical protein
MLVDIGLGSNKKNGFRGVLLILGHTARVRIFPMANGIFIR